MVLKFEFQISIRNGNIVFDILKDKEINIIDVINNGLFLFGNKEFLIIELDKEVILKHIASQKKYKFEKSEILRSGIKYAYSSGTSYEI